MRLMMENGGVVVVVSRGEMQLTDLGWDRLVRDIKGVTSLGGMVWG